MRSNIWSVPENVPRALEEKGLSRAFSRLIILCLGVGLFQFIYLESVELPERLYSYLSQTWGRFVIASDMSASLSFWDSHWVCVGLLAGVPPITFLQSVFFPFLSLDHFHCPVLKFVDSSACSDLPLSLSRGSLSYCTFSSRTFLGFLCSYLHFVCTLLS